MSENWLRAEGAKHLAEALKTNSALEKLEYAASCPPPYCQHPLTELAFCALPFCSLASNALCGIMYGQGTYTAEGITKLAEALKSNSSLRELKYAYSLLLPPLTRHHTSVSTR